MTWKGAWPLRLFVAHHSNARTLERSPAPPLQRFALCAPTLGDGGGGRSTGSPSPSWRRGHAQRARWSGARPPPVLRPDGGHRCAPTLGGGGRSTGSPSPTRRRRGHAQRARWSGARRSPCSRSDGGHRCAPTLERFALCAPTLQRSNAPTLLPRTEAAKEVVLGDHRAIGAAHRAADVDIRIPTTGIRDLRWGLNDFTVRSGAVEINR